MILVLTGLFSSSVHLHSDSYDISSDQQTIFQDHNFCPICASQFTYEVNHNADYSIGLHYSLFQIDIPSFILPDPLISIQNYRAPPLASLIA
ncbi:hypothetical protein [Rhodohalobacter sp. 614A]|uniref:hypothetical protein n=1 Tax=Rhodohalobacter sp. 614A TaxID=2908649 RepID=UPI001F3F3FF4|nr:hypothetical protein [Rhodohalobacter sp. 614A]